MHTGRKSKRIFSSSVALIVRPLAGSPQKAGGYAFFCYFTGCPGKNLLTTMTDSEQAAFAGAFCTKAVLTDLFSN